MSIRMEQLSWIKRAAHRSNVRTISYASYPGFTPASRLTTRENSIMSGERSLEESPDEKLVNKTLEHCFKQYRLKDEYPHIFLKLKANRFGPPRSRRRIFIAPPMEGITPAHLRSQLPAPFCQTEKAAEEAPVKLTEKEELQQLEAWIEERKKMQDLLSNCVDLEKWLKAKHSVSEQEESVLGKIRECRELNKAKSEAKLSAVISAENLAPKISCKKIIPLIDAPYPESLMTLQNILHKHKLKLVDIFSKADRTKTMKFKRADFLKIMQATKIPISHSVLEDAIIYLTSSKKGNYITNEDLVECQKIWLDNTKEQWKHSKETKDAQAPVSQKLDLLEVPPINTEPDAMHLTYNQMEMVGKRYKEMRRQLKRKIDPLEWLEQCRMVRTGDLVVDGHCLPSTIEGEMGEVVDHYRLACHLVYTQCVKLCAAYGIPLTEKLLKKALLYPADKIITDGKNTRKLRQPGGYYVDLQKNNIQSPKERPRSSSKDTESKPKSKKKRVKTEQTLNYRWISFEEFKNLMRSSKKLYPSRENVHGESDDDDDDDDDIPSFLEEIIDRELRRMFAFLNPKTSPNSFWPGHLLDKLRLYLPQVGRDEGDAIFSHVSCTRPVYPGTYNPYRSWPISDQGYVTYGDSDYRKNYYYI